MHKQKYTNTQIYKRKNTQYTIPTIQEKILATVNGTNNAHPNPNANRNIQASQLRNMHNVLNRNSSQQLDDLTPGYRADGENPDGWEDDAGLYIYMYKH